MNNQDKKKLTKKIIKVIKNFEFNGADKITPETKITDIVNDNWVDYNIFMGNVEEYCEIEIPDDEMFYNIYDGTVKDLIDYVALEMKINEYESINHIGEDEYEKITEEEIDEIIENIDRKIKESILNEITLNKIRWNEKDKESYKNAL